MDSERKPYGESIEKIYKSLEDIHRLLLKVNRLDGSIKRYHDMKNEIEQIGWTAICAKYHPDINIIDPAAFELFEFYKYVYSTMDSKPL